MLDKLESAQAKFHRDRAALLEKQYQAKKTAGENRIWKQQEALKFELSRFRRQIEDHLRKAAEVSFSGT